MPLQYAEKINAARSGMGEGGREAGKDSITECENLFKSRARKRTIDWSSR